MPDEGENMRKYAALVLALSVCPIARATQTITVSGSIDGSGIVAVGPTRVTWDPFDGATPTSLLVNGTSWDPAVNSTATLTGPLFPVPLSNYNVSTEVTSGRDLANAQIVGNQVLLYLDDTPDGPDNYSVQVSFTPKPPVTPSTFATLHITGNIDGSDVLEIYNTGATWVHEQWGNPTDVALNGMAWDTVDDPTITNSGATTFLPAGVDLSSVVFTKNGGRDTATYQLFSDHIDVYFADDPVGASAYDVTLSFGSNAPEPASLATLAAGAVMLMARRRVRRR